MKMSIAYIYGSFVFILCIYGSI